MAVNIKGLTILYYEWYNELETEEIKKYHSLLLENISKTTVSTMKRHDKCTSSANHKSGVTG